MWRTKDFDEVGRHLRCLRGAVANGQQFAIGDGGKIERIGDRLRARARVPPAAKPASDAQPSLDLFY